MAKRLTKADKFQLQMRSMFWAFDQERYARADLEKACLESLPKCDREAAYASFQRREEWRDAELVKAFGMTYRQLHDLAFKANGRLA